MFIYYQIYKSNYVCKIGTFEIEQLLVWVVIGVKVIGKRSFTVWEI